MRAELAGRVDQISALHSELFQKQLEVSTMRSPRLRLVVGFQHFLGVDHFRFPGSKPPYWQRVETLLICLLDLYCNSTCNVTNPSSSSSSHTLGCKVGLSGLRVWLISSFLCSFW